MRTYQRMLSLTALTLACSAGAACKKSGETQQPGGVPKSAVIDPEQASKAAKEDFAKVANRYEKARERGELSPGQCSDLAKDFKQVYEDHGKQMTIAWFNAGAVWEQCGDVDKAEEIYLAITKKVPEYDLAYNNLGVIYWNRKQEGKALTYFKKAVDANKTTRQSRNNLAAALRDHYSTKPNESEFKDAERYLQNVLAIDSNNRLAYENLARLYYDRGRLVDKSYLLLADLVVTQAMDVLKKEEVESADLYNIKGLLFMQRDNQVDALKAFKKAVELEPQHADANMNVAMISLRFRDYKQAEESLKIALKDNRQQKNIETYIGMGVAQRGLRKYDDAEQSFKQAMKVHAGDPRPLYNLGILYHEHIAPASEDIYEQYKVAKQYFKDFASKAGGKGDLSDAVQDAKSRIASIDEAFKIRDEMKKLEEEVKRLEEQQKRQEEEERKRLLELERKAKAAAGGGDAKGGDAAKE